MKTTRLVCLLMSLLTAHAAHAQWVQTNGPYGGFVTCLTISGTDLLAGTQDAGVYRSTDRGTNWMKANNGLGTGKVGAFASAGKYLFVATADGVFRSVDNGVTWTNAGLSSSGHEIPCLTAMDTILIASVESWESHLFRSTDFGASWTIADSGLPVWEGKVIEVSVLAASDTDLFAGTYDGVFRSTDAGTHWMPTEAQNQDVITLLVSGTSLFAEFDCSGLFRSTNRGTTWAAANTGLPNRVIQTLIASGTDLFAGTGGAGVYRSTDNGQHWTAVNRGLTGSDISSLAIYSDSTGGLNLFAGVYGGGVYRSTNAGADWTEASTDMMNTYTISLVSCGSFLVAGTHGGGVYRSSDYGMHWTAVNNDLTSNWISSLAVSDTELVAGTTRGIFGSTDNGSHWTRVGAELLTNIPVTALAADTARVFAGVIEDDIGKLYRSTDHGASWAAVSTFGQYSHVSALLTSGMSVFVGTNFIGQYGGVIRSTDGGSSWESVSNGLGRASTPPIELLAKWDTVLFAGTYEGIFRSTNRGDVWMQIRSGYAQNFASSGSTLFAGTSGGVFLSTDGGTTWQDANIGLTHPSILALTVSGPYLFASIGEQGVWRRPLIEMMAVVENGISSVGENVPAGFSLAQNYPNPFNSSTRIKFALPHQSHVRLTVFNALGQKVADLVNGEMQAGYHETAFDGNNLASGVYFYRLETGTFVAIKRLVLLR